MSDVIVLGRDEVGVVAESDGFRYYLTPCCGASAKGLEDYIGCRACYVEVDPSLGGVPDKTMHWDPTTRQVTFETKPIAFVEVYGDGIDYDDWKARRGNG